MSFKMTWQLHLRLTTILCAILACAVLLAAGCGSEPSSAPAAPAPTASSEETAPEAKPATDEKQPSRTKRGRVVILGFDGVEPTIVDAMFAANELPNLAKLRDKGSYRRLTSSIPPQSPSAWTSFLTCKNTGAHGIYDFLVRDPASQLPKAGFGRTDHAKLGEDGSLQSPAKFVSNRKGESFWKEADAQGLKCTSLMVPFAFPADDLAHGHMLCGLGVQDIRGTDSWFFSFSDTYAALESASGGFKVPLSFVGDVAKVTIPGARDARKDFKEPGAYVEAEIAFTVNRAENSVTVKTPGDEFPVKKNEWSKWTEWTFELSPQYSVKAISRFYVLDAGEHVKVYMACLQYHPKAPYIRFTTPESYSGELQDRYGLFKTIGWTYDTHALRQDVLTDDAFLEDVAQTMAWYERLTLDELERNEHDMLLSAWTGPDRVSHMFWRFRDPKHPLYTEEGARKYGRAVEDTYKKMDETVGKVMAKLAPDDLLMILSDHGFKSFRRGFNVNTWLVRNGYLTITGQTDAATAQTQKKPSFLTEFDWSASKAYSVGMGAVFLNLKGREGRGTVEPSEADRLAAEIRGKLLAVTDPETGEKVFDNIYTSEVFTGEAAADAPDLQLAYADGYQSSKSTASGGAPEHLFEPNDDKWSGEHASSDAANTPGIFFSNQNINTETPRIVDLGVTALEYLGASAPADYEGEPLL